MPGKTGRFPADIHDRNVADRRLGARWWTWFVAGWLAWAFVFADGVTAAWSLIAAQPWSWDRFGTVVGPALGGGVGSTVGQLLVLRGAIPSRARVRRKLKANHETVEAIRTGILPPGADPQEWRLRVQGQLRPFIATLWAVAALCVTAAVLTVVVAHLTSHDDPVLWAVAAVALLLTAAPIGLANWARSRGRLLLAQL